MSRCDLYVLYVLCVWFCVVSCNVCMGMRALDDNGTTVPMVEGYAAVCMYTSMYVRTYVCMHQVATFVNRFGNACHVDGVEWAL